MKRLGVVLLVGGLVGVAGFSVLARSGWLGRGTSPAGDPRLTPPVALRNVHPDVKYVGDAACAACHPDQTATYRQHPMGRSFAPVSSLPELERYDPAAQNPFERSGFHFAVERRGGHMLHKESRRDARGRVVTEYTAEVRYAIGSGTRGRSYLVERDGYLFQSPVSWFSQQGVWDLTPSFRVVEHFERPAQVDCLFCHCNHAEAVEHALGRYRPPIFQGYAIGCERCHGPGDLHVQAREAGEVVTGVDPTIVNPRHLPSALRDAVCEQCHLQGESRVVRRGRRLFDYRPGLPLHEFLSVFVRADEFTDHRKAGSHAAQMTRSRCYRESQGRLGCISCHDAHEKPTPGTEAVFYRQRCLSCHREASCGLTAAVRRRKSPADSCIECHMPRADSSNIAHTAVTDHRIVRRADDGNRPAPSRRPGPGESPLVHFHHDLVDPQDAEVSRDLGLALAHLARSYPALGSYASRTALPLLEAAVERRPEDVPAREDYGFVLWRLDRKEEALAAFEGVLDQAPERELTLTYAAVLATDMERPDAAIAYWRRAVAVNPWSSQYRYQLAVLLARREQWQPAVQESETALRLNPGSDEIRTLLITCYLRTGQREPARREFDKLVALKPAQEPVLRRWFTEQMR